MTADIDALRTAYLAAPDGSNQSLNICLQILTAEAAATPAPVPARITPEFIAAGAEGVPYDRWVKLSAADQRARFGGVPFSRRQIRRTAKGFQVLRVVAYGQDYNIQDWSFVEVAALVKGQTNVVGRKD